MIESAGSKREAFARDGYVFLPRVFDPRSLDALEESIVRIALRHLELAGTHAPVETRDDPRRLFEFIEKTDPKLFYTLAKHVGTTVEAFATVADPHVLDVVREVSGPAEWPLFPQPLTFFYNQAATTRLQYDWHQESSSAVEIPNGYHIWFPIFADIAPDNGPMLLAKGSHHERLPFVVESKAGHLTQWRLSIDVPAQFEVVECAMSRGDAVLFHHNMVHSSGHNLSDRPRLSAGVRYFNCIAADEFFPLIEYTYAGKTHQHEEERRSTDGGPVGAPQN